MKYKKMILVAAILAVLGCTAVPCTGFAAEQINGAATEFSYVKQNEPTYTVSIPATLALSDEGTPLEITASNVVDLGEKRISVTIAGTSYYRNQMVLEGETTSPSYSKELRYQFIGTDGTVIETTGEDTVSGREIASFTENVTVTYLVKPISSGEGINIEPGIAYTGTMTFGISLVD